jgi:mRNA interferase RelE/StbE
VTKPLPEAVRYELGTTPPARRALSERLPSDVAAAAVEFITGPLLEAPYRVGKPLGEELTGIYSARLGRLYRIMYEIDEAKHLVTVLDIRHRSVAYRPR